MRQWPIWGFKDIFLVSFACGQALQFSTCQEACHNGDSSRRRVHPWPSPETTSKDLPRSAIRSEMLNRLEPISVASFQEAPRASNPMPLSWTLTFTDVSASSSTTLSILAFACLPTVVMGLRTLRHRMASVSLPGALLWASLKPPTNSGVSR